MRESTLEELVAWANQVTTRHRLPPELYYAAPLPPGRPLPVLSCGPACFIGPLGNTTKKPSTPAK